MAGTRNRRSTMNLRTIIGVTALLGGIVTATAGEKTFVSLRDFKETRNSSARASRSAVR